ncbi:hypothetical protein Tco_0506830 [Tanacetum coccineum]
MAEPRLLLPPYHNSNENPYHKLGEEYNIWCIEIATIYLPHRYNLWDIIVDGDLQEEVASAGEQSSPPAPKTAKQLTAKRNQEMVKSTLLLAIPDEYLLNLLDSTNKVSTASGNFGVNIAGGTKSSSQVSSTPGTDEVNQGKRSYGDNGRRNATTNEPSSQALVAQDGLGGYDWSNDFDKPVNYALMAISSSSSSGSSDNEICLHDHLVVDSGCSSHMTGNKAYLSDYENYNGGFVAFGNDPKGDELKYQENDKEPTQEYILLPLHPHRLRISVEDVVQDAQEKPSETSPKDTDVHDSEDVNLMLIAIDDVQGQPLKEEKKMRDSSCFTSIYSNFNMVGHMWCFTNSPLFSNELNISPYAVLPISSMVVNTDLEDVSNVFPNDGIFQWSYDDEDTISQALKDESWVEAMQEEYSSSNYRRFGYLLICHLGKSQLAQSGSSRIRGWWKGVKSAFLYGTIEEEVYVYQTPGFVDAAHPNKVYKVKQQPDGIFISQDKYVADILKKFDFYSIRTTTTPIESNKPLVKDEDSVDVDVHVYRSMIGSLMYLTASRPDIMFAVCACARFQVTPKASHLNVVKRIFRYLKHQPKLGLWYPRDSPFELEAFSNSDYGGASLDRKSTTCGCQFLGRRLISWQCKKQTIMANSTTEAEYVAAANCCGQVLWIQNQMMDYGFNFMNTRIHIDNESTISVIKNPVAHSRTKHIEIRFHFIRDCYEKRLIEVIKIHTDSNVADLLTKGFDVIRFNFLDALARGC